MTKLTAKYQKPRKYILPKQQAVELFYNSTSVQIGVACVIGANFATNIVEKQIDPYGDKHNDVFSVFEFIYNVLFTIELAVNMYGHWCCRFWKSGWNIFDCVVVSIGVLGMLERALPISLPSALKLLRNMRAFRVFRLFKRVRSLNKIIVAIAHAVPGVLNAFLILAIVMSIYAILAVEFYQSVGELCQDDTSPDRWFRTVRGLCVGEEYFGSFSKSFYSFFQVLTGESWSEAVARPVIWYFIDDPIRAIGSGLFFMSYICGGAFVLTNVVVSVLIDNMCASEESEEDGEAEEAAADAPQEVVDSNGVGITVEEPSKSDGNDTSIQTGKLDAINMQVSKLTSFSGRMRTDLDNTRREMVSLGQQLDTVLRLVQSSA